MKFISPALMVVLLIACTAPEPEHSSLEEEHHDKVINGSDAFGSVVWNIKAIHPSGKTVDIKAFDKEGGIFDVKGIQDSDQRQLIDIKALVNGKKASIKVLPTEGDLSPVKAITEDGNILDIKAIASNGQRLDVKGVSRVNNIINIKAIDETGAFYGVKAISPSGKWNDVKGVKMMKEDLEGTVHGIEFHAHVKALPQSGCEASHPIWHVKAISEVGSMLDVKALDKEGNLHDVKASQINAQRQLMDVKARINGNLVPIKILESEDSLAPVKAIGDNGEIYDVKALTTDGTRLDVKGVSANGAVIDIKAINVSGNYLGVKAISPNGQLNDVKGIKMNSESLETIINGVRVHAHVKAIPQID